MSLSKVVNVAEIEARGSIKDTDVLKMRRAFYEDGAICESEAETLPDIIREMLLTTTSERQGRVIDHDQSASMEKKKQEGYF